MQSIARSVLLLLSACVCICAPSAWGQSERRLSIIVANPEGRAISKAEVVLFTDGGALAATAVQASEYEYVFSAFPSGQYQLAISSQGFVPIRVPITDKTPEQIAVALRPGEGSMPNQVCDIRGREYEMPRPVAVASYVRRKDQKHLMGTVTDAWGGALSGTVLLLLQDQLNAPEVKKAAKDDNSNNWWYYSAPRQTLIASTTANEKGEFQFEFPYGEVDLEPGWYEINAIHDGFVQGAARVWIASGALTELSPISLRPSGLLYSCQSPLIHRQKS